MDKRDIGDFTLEELEKAVLKAGEPPYRAKQIYDWVYEKGISNFEEMSNMPKSLVDKLSRDYRLDTPQLFEHLKSRDRTEKFLFKLADGNYIETVLICSGKRKTVCLSTQVGCKFACSFCASGRMGFVRSLTTSEIVKQVRFLKQRCGHKITNYVFMGMGEPLDNYDNLVKAIMIMNTPEGLSIGARRITISTCGLIEGIRRLGNLGLQVNLSLSLHSADNKVRDTLMTVNKRHPVQELVRACEQFVKKLGRMITLECVLLRGINDSLDDADKLALVAKRLGAKVNLIPYSEIPGADFKPTASKNTNIFVKRLAEKGIKVTLRQSRGKDIQAACGQLAGRRKDEI